jgi:hypothetical protein
MLAPRAPGKPSSASILLTVDSATPDRPNLTYEWNGLTRVWRWTRERMQQHHKEGRLVYTSSGMPRFKRYLDEMPGIPLTDVWTDIPPLRQKRE